MRKLALVLLLAAAGCAPATGPAPAAGKPAAKPTGKPVAQSAKGGTTAAGPIVPHGFPKAAATPPPGFARADGSGFEALSWAGDGGAAGTVLGVAALASGRAVAVGEPGVIWMTGDAVRVAPLAEGVATAVWADGPDYAVAVGYGGLAWSWNGSKWTPIPPVTDADLLAVWGHTVPGGREVFAGGAHGTILKLVKEKWQPMTAPSGVAISAFAGAGNVLWAAGQVEGHSEPADGVILQLDGKGAWDDVCPELACGSAIFSAWADAPDDLWTAGAGGELARYSAGNSELIALGTGADLTGVWGTGAKDVFVVGDEGVCLHWDGTMWKPVAAVDEDLRGVDGLPNGEAWAVGADGALLHLVPAPMTVGTNGSGG